MNARLVSARESELSDQLTIILTLRDRPLYSPFFLRNNWAPGRHLLVLDGSHSSQNAQIFNSAMGEGLTYLRFPPDVTYADYISKVHEGLKYVKTRFAVMIDNDDILLWPAALRGVEALSQSQGATLAGGDLVQFTHSGPESAWASVPMVLTRLRELGDHSGLEAVAANRLNYRHVWNCIAVVESLRHSWKSIFESNVVEPHLVEFLLADLMLAQGRLVWLRRPHYMRLERQHHRAIFDLPRDASMRVGSEDWWVQCEEADQIVAQQLGIPSASILPSMNSRFQLLDRGIFVEKGHSRFYTHARKFVERWPRIPLDRTMVMASRGWAIPWPLLTE